MPGVLDECDGNVAQGWGKLAANASALDLFVVGVAGSENARLECMLNNEWNVLGVESALLWMVNVAPADV